jgi:hypothetical protein|tara:strand:+ start:1389 stop:1958 length:570 start_codon:yes stop_codon:yes gene_type:complete
MRSPYCFIVEPLNNRRYDNIKKIGDGELITSVSEEDYQKSNRYAKVISLPLNYNGEVSIGDTLLVHHNVFKFYNDIKGRRKSGKSYFKENLFFIENDQFFLYKNNNYWSSHGKYCFVEPILTKKSVILKNTKYEPLQGIIKYSNNQLEELGVYVGDKVIFTPNSEYEFEVEGEKLYRMFTNNITTILNE